MQERVVEACLMRGRPARADSTLALRGLQAETSIDEERTLPRRPSPHRGCPAYRRGSDRGSCDDYRRRNGGAEGSRTPDPKTASLVLSQLSYSPTREVTLQARVEGCQGMVPARGVEPLDRKSTRLNSSHGYISYAVFCLKKKKKETHEYTNGIMSSVHYRSNQIHSPHLQAHGNDGQASHFKSIWQLRSLINVLLHLPCSI